MISKLNTQKYDYAEPRRGDIFIASGVNPGYKKTRYSFWRDFCRMASKNHDKTKAQYIKFTL